ncbi:MAG TPA: PAS domain S-box protein, partial [Balneolaceae bacterium]|nr:PAS domain S-box protein [Balneolaceae bacterium]
QSYSADNAHAKRILKDSQMRVNSIAMVHEKLYQTEDFSEVDINQYFEELSVVIHKTMKRSETKVQIDLDITPIKLPITQAIPCGLLLNEIITNSYKHAFKGKKRGRIIVSLSKKL